ncbi:hypothetical protein V8F20_010947 [Naviculisporaceae sp. PSN 640]
MSCATWSEYPIQSVEGGDLESWTFRTRTTQEEVKNDNQPEAAAESRIETRRMHEWARSCKARRGRHDRATWSYDKALAFHVLINHRDLHVNMSPSPPAINMARRNPTHLAPITLTNPTIPVGSLILVTGANGLNASNTIAVLLEAGYHVRGTVRSLHKCNYLTALFPASKFSLVEIPDVAEPGAWAEALKGVSGVIHCIGATDIFPSDVDAAAKDELKWQIDLLSTACDVGTIKSFVLTSSAWAAWTPDPSKKTTLTQSSWNEEAVTIARDKSIDPSKKGLAGYMALKTLVEQGIWDWVNRENPPFAFNALLLDTVIGSVLSPKDQGVPSTAGMVHWIYEGKHADMLNGVLPQWHINTGDAAKLYVAILASSPQVDRERIFGFGERFSFYRVKEILMKQFPDHETWAEVKDSGWDQTTVPIERGEELLRRVGQTTGWTGLEESVLENTRAWAELEGRGVTDDRYSTLN